MKIRTDFVTNSSSSSFVSVYVSGEKFLEILNQYKNAFEALKGVGDLTFLPEFYDNALSMEKRGVPAFTMSDDDKLAMSVYCEIQPELSDYWQIVKSSATPARK